MSHWAGGFATTQWTVVRSAAASNPSENRPAFAQLFERYSEPLYFLARQKGLDREDAEDAIQEFFVKILGESFVRNADPQLGRFRHYLSVAWKRFLVDEYRKGQSIKRGGGQKKLSLDFGASEENWIATSIRNDEIFDFAWAKTVLSQAESSLRIEYAKRDKLRVFETLMPLATKAIDQLEYIELGKNLEISPSATKVALHRLRKRFGETLRNIVAETVDSQEEIDSELDLLLRSIAAQQ